MPQDVCAEVFDWPVELFRKRVWHAPEPAALERAVALIKAAVAPHHFSATIYAGASEELRALATTTGIPVGRHPGRQGRHQLTTPKPWAAWAPPAATRKTTSLTSADLIIGVGTRYPTSPRPQDPVQEPDEAREHQRHPLRRRQGERAELVVADSRGPGGPDRGARGGVEAAYSEEITAEKRPGSRPRAATT